MGLEWPEWQIMIALVRYMESPTVWNHLLIIWNHRLFGRYIIKFGITYYSCLIIFVGFLSSSSSFKLWPTHSFQHRETRRTRRAYASPSARLFCEGSCSSSPCGRWGRPRWMIISNDHKAQQMYMEVGVGLLKVPFPISD